LTGKRAFLHEHFGMKQFSDGRILITILIQNLKIFISLKNFMEIRAPEGGLPKIGSKIAKHHSQKRRFCWYNGDIEGIFPNRADKKIEGPTWKIEK
jgi:hypothetical protein